MNSVIDGFIILKKSNLYNKKMKISTYLMILLKYISRALNKHIIYKYILKLKFDTLL